MKKLVLGLCTWVSALPCVLAQEAGSAISYPVESLVMAYGRSHPEAPSLETLASTEVELMRDGHQLAGEGTGSSVLVRLDQPLPAGTVITQSGVHRILSALVAAVNESGVYGVVAFPNRDQIDPQTKEDLRSPDDKSLKVVIWLSEVAKVRTIAKGERLRGGSGVMNPMHARLLGNSPLIPLADGQPGSLIFKERLDEYLRRLNRHPGRRVEAAISSTDQPGRVVLDYLVSENRPWFVYAQVSNTGTEATDELRQRFGFVHNQLLNRDDVLSLDYITSNFNEANAAFLSYDIPVLYPDRLRARAFGSWGDFDATVQLPASQERFTGSSWSAGAELIWNPLQIWGTSIDLTAGLAKPHYEVLNLGTGTPGEADLLTPYLIIGAERMSETINFSANLGYETNLESIPENQLRGLGRLDVIDGYDLLRFDLSATAYLEPLFRRDGEAGAIGAHEVWFQTRLQHILGGERLIPQKEQAVGGFFSVRGYPESAAAGDSTWVSNLEYRFHLPRALRPTSEINMNAGDAAEPAPTLFGRPFNYRPPRVTSRPDWDLIFRAFVDYGQVNLNDQPGATPDQAERDHTLMSVGVGLELQVLRYVNARIDFGYALEDLQTGIVNRVDGSYTPVPNDTDAGDTRLHFLVTFVW